LHGLLLVLLRLLLPLRLVLQLYPTQWHLHPQRIYTAITIYTAIIHCIHTRGGVLLIMLAIVRA
jgi:hypothetical protein